MQSSRHAPRAVKTSDSVRHAEKSNTHDAQAVKQNNTSVRHAERAYYPVSTDIEFALGIA